MNSFLNLAHSPSFSVRLRTRVQPQPGVCRPQQTPRSLQRRLPVLRRSRPNDSPEGRRRGQLARLGNQRCRDGKLTFAHQANKLGPSCGQLPPQSYAGKLANLAAVRQEQHFRASAVAPTLRVAAWPTGSTTNACRTCPGSHGTPGARKRPWPCPSTDAGGSLAQRDS